MLTMLFETGHPWITFKDACNVRSPQQHAGVVHSSNLCTEITLNTSDTETAVCNLGSVNLLQHLKDGGGRPRQARRSTITTAMRMLDNVIDINYYAVKKARDSNMRHRPVGLGVMGFQDALYELRIPYASQAGGGVRRRVDGGGLLPRLLGLDRAGPRARQVLQLQGLAVGQGHPAAGHAGAAGARQRGGYVEVDRSATLDWDALRKKIAKDGMRNSNCVAIAPTATISNIIGVDASIEPCFGNLSVKSNLSGEFTVINHYLVRDLKRLGLWDDVMVMDLKHFDGSLRPIDRVPQDVKALYATAFEVEPVLAGRSRRAPPEVDRPGAVAQHLHGRRIGQEARRHLQAGLAARPEDHLLPAHHQRHARREIHGAIGPPERRVVAAAQRCTARHERARRCGRCGAGADERAAPATDIKFCAIDDPGCEACQ